MTHIVEVDQSIRFDDTRRDTVLACADGLSFSVLIPATVKRECVRVLRDLDYSTRNLYIQLFTVGLYFLLKGRIGELVRITIDLEYLGRDAQIREHLINLFRREGIQVKAEQIQFAQIGKQSPAHDLAISTFRGEKVADIVLTVEDMLEQFRRGRRREKGRGRKGEGN